MSTVVAGVDFGTLNVRVSIFDSGQGRLGAGVAEYPLHRKKDDPDHATQSHADHMSALVEATRQALAQAGVAGSAVKSIAVDTALASYPSAKISSRSTTTICGAIIAPGARPPKSPRKLINPDCSPSNGAARPTPPNGDSQNCCIGCGIIRKNAAISSPPLSIAIT
jgi:hypothetical protein